MFVLNEVLEVMVSWALPSLFPLIFWLGLIRFYTTEESPEL